MEGLIDRRIANELAAHFNAIQKHVPLHPVRTAAEHEAAVSALNALLDSGAADEAHPLAGLAATLGELIGDFEDEYHPPGLTSALDVLRHLMQAHGLKQGELPEIGTQGVVSEVLAGRRALNLRQIRALARRFAVPPSVFIDRLAAAG